MTDLAAPLAAQLGFALLLSLYTFCRTESFFPKSMEGRERFDPEQHLQRKDVDVRNYDGKPAFRATTR